MDKMREEFNDAVATGAIIPDFFCVTSGYSSSIKWLSDDWDGENYKSDKLQSAWSIWKASRAALCVELPTFENGSIRGYSGDCEEARMVVDCVAESLEKAGVSYE